MIKTVRKSISGKARRIVFGVLFTALASMPAMIGGCGDVDDFKVNDRELILPDGEAWELACRLNGSERCVSASGQAIVFYNNGRGALFDQSYNCNNEYGWCAAALFNWSTLEDVLNIDDFCPTNDTLTLERVAYSFSRNANPGGHYEDILTLIAESVYYDGTYITRLLQDITGSYMLAGYRRNVIEGLDTANVIER